MSIRSKIQIEPAMKITTDSVICLIGLGEVGAIVGEDLKAAGFANLRAFDTAFSRSSSVQLETAKRLGIQVAPDSADAAQGAALIICAVTAANDLAAAHSVATHCRDAFYLDLNSASPAVKQSAAQIIGDGGGHYVEAAVMSPYPPKRNASPMLIGGPHASQFARFAKSLGFTGVEVFSDQFGKASATKMCRSVMVKGLEALVTESMLSARHYGVEQVVLKSLSDLFPLGDWNQLSKYMISRSIEHGVRRAEEMREVARTVEEAGLESIMSSACAQRQEWAPKHKQALSEESLESMLDNILAANIKSPENSQN